MNTRTLLVLALLCTSMPAPALDSNANQQSDIWEILFGATSLPALGDADHDGWTNAQESGAGTNPLDPHSFPSSALSSGVAGQVHLSWPSAAGKNYAIYGSPDLNPANYTLMSTVSGDGSNIATPFDASTHSRWFFKLAIADVDSDLDGLTDWEEMQLGFNPALNHSDRNDTADLSRVQSTLTAASTITVGLIDGDMREDWPDKGVVVIRRSGGLRPLTVNLTLTGTATRNTDYTTNIASTQIVLPMGARETWVELTPVNDASAEGVETIVVTAIAGSGYSLGSVNNATVTLGDASSLPCAKEAARFLIQAAFGPDQDDAADADIIPENVEALMAQGLEAWIDDQFTRPIGYIQPYTNWALQYANGLELYGNYKEHAWWERAMGVPKLRPDSATTQLPDPLRQRVAFALSEILVTSDRADTLAVDYEGMANYYDIFEANAFGNYLDILKQVAMHPVMGVYLSHLGNQKAIPALNIHPDENFAREVMQLFSIGLWQLNTDGTRKTYPAGDPQAGQFIPTYSNSDITELARVFTGLTWYDSTSFDANNLINGDRLHPMKIFDAYHDCGAKTLLNGLNLAASTPSSGSTGTAGMADINAAITNLFNHPNVGPFIGRLLIQRLVTSNPSAAYIGRVAAKFNDNGSGVRGDMKAFIKAILMDPEARDPAMMDSPTFGKMREPFLRVVNLARAFNAASTSGRYPLDQFNLDHQQDPQNSPSVFNFFLPGHSPPGPVTQMGLVAPEFQIVNASSAITGANYFYNAIGNNSLHRWGSGTPAYNVALNLDPELGFIIPAAHINEDTPSVSNLLDLDLLIRRYDMMLLGGTMSPQLFQAIRESVDRVKPPDTSWQWHRERLRQLITSIVSSAEYNVMR
ncbi:DUF1800 domain-containing protein [Prosthecobacter vanneervenii]|uniref:Uncharacterized protein (DUF1800 family) n=1 Tax=Prosthecobacter vanneervenii TaxID=48466 RepID=A0A7W8DJG3_9BACT|nr:DUF1800 family protein [Prosthecobacter vanneervenii]MBB5032000.1 uncharacterized protein (DUF1800 family) [Prosthecobacter vanneervenii]